jgi:hypothetical protein
MANLIALVSVKEQYMVGICHSLIAADVPHVNAAIREYKMCIRSTFFSVTMTTNAPAKHVP